MRSIDDKYKTWVKSDLVSKEDKNILRKMTQEERSDAFFKDIEFGTAGMRGVMGPGSNRLNFFTILKAAVCYGEYLVEKFPDARQRGVVIAHDNRMNSREFCNETAEILNVNGINVYIFDSLRPTPELSFAIRYLNCVGGIVITASHNPKEYNGFKVYDENGCQLVPDKIERLLEIIASKDHELATAVSEFQPHGETNILNSEVDDAYCQAVLGIRLNPDVKKEGYKIVFSPQHGTSYVNLMRIFNEAGYEIVPVTSQCDPDPNFSGTESPNPESPKAYTKALEIAESIKAPLIITTDPDADRVGIAYLASDGTYRKLNGNEAGALLLDYVLSQRQAKGLLSPNGVMFNTIVTSSFGENVAKQYGVKTISLLTGFKFIGDKIHEFEIEENGPHFEFGYEESYGALIAPFVRDKDGLQASLLYAELACFYHEQGLCLDEVLYNLQRKLGEFYKDAQYSVEFKGAEGSENMKNLLSKVREKPFKEISRLRVVAFEDYLESKRYEGEEVKELTLPKSDVMRFILEDKSVVSIRPSGTEPKCKIYVNAVGRTKDEVFNKPQRIYLYIKNILKI